MSEMSKPTPSHFSVSLPAKRKRGRPRKVGDTIRKVSTQVPVIPTLDNTRKIEQPQVNVKDGTNDMMEGMMVYGVVEGSFDAGYFISVRSENNGIPLRGVVFQPGKFVPITAADDIAPRARRYHRKEIPIPGLNPRQDEGNGISSEPERRKKQPVLQSNSSPMCQTTVTYVLNNVSTPAMVSIENMPRTSSTSSLPVKIIELGNSETGLMNQSQTVAPNLRMVEQDEVMQVFEVSTSPDDPKSSPAGAENEASKPSPKAQNNSLPGNGSTDPTSRVQEKGIEIGDGSNMILQDNLKALNLDHQQNPQADMSQFTRLEAEGAQFGPRLTEIVSGDMESQHNGTKQNSLNELQTSSLQETHAVAQLQSLPKETHPTESLLQATGMELKRPNLELHQNLFGGHSECKSHAEYSMPKFQPGDMLQNASKCPNTEPEIKSFPFAPRSTEPNPGMSDLFQSGNMTSPFAYQDTMVNVSHGDYHLVNPDLVQAVLENHNFPPKNDSVDDTHFQHNADLIQKSHNSQSSLSEHEKR